MIKREQLCLTNNSVQICDRQQADQQVQKGEALCKCMCESEIASGQEYNTRNEKKSVRGSRWRARARQSTSRRARTRHSECVRVCESERGVSVKPGIIQKVAVRARARGEEKPERARESERKRGSEQARGRENCLLYTSPSPRDGLLS
eukprot:4446121-Pleurochrysis_carterae.AAC.1